MALHYRRGIIMKMKTGSCAILLLPDWLWMRGIWIRVGAEQNRRSNALGKIRNVCRQIIQLGVTLRNGRRVGAERYCQGYLI